jgi:hypothetical protein
MADIPKYKKRALERLISYIRFERANFDGIQKGKTTIPEGEVTDFIRMRTRNYFATWVIPLVIAFINDDRDSIKRYGEIC